MKIFQRILFVVMSFIPWAVCGQGLINDGGYINIAAGGWVHVDGDALGMYTNNTSSSLDGRIDIEGILEVEGNWTNNAANNVFINLDRDGTVLLDGTTLQVIGGSSPTFFENLTEDNNADVQLDVDNSADGILFLINGAFILNSHTMTIDNILTNAISRVNGFIISETIDGDPNPCYSRINWVVQNGTGVYEIPFATYAASYIPFQFDVTSAGSGNGGIVVSTYHSAVDNTPYASYPSLVTNINDPWARDNTANTADRFWLVNFTGFTVNPVATLKVTFDGTTDSDTITESNLQAQAWDGTTWLPLIGTADDVNNTVSNITGVNNSYVWTLSNYGNPPLPVELLSFNAVCNAKYVSIAWVTASETNNDHFDVERSDNLIDWESIISISGAGNSNQVLNYQAYDYDPLDGPAYYRLKQTDYNGSFEYSDMVTTDCSEENNNAILNVIQSGTNLVVVCNETFGQNIDLRLFNMCGQLLRSADCISSSASNHILLDISNVSPGIYLIAASGPSDVSTKKFTIH